MDFSEEQVLSLAPDASSLKSGKDLANKSKWKLLAYNDKAIWGLCQGSGADPYKAQVDIQQIAFKCSCPSRKFPCKHGLGLLFLYVRDKGGFTAEAAPDWVSDWIGKRQEKATATATKTEKPVDAEAQAKRAEARNKKVHEGIAELQVWIKDLIRGGLLQVPENAYTFWQNPAKRLIDAQAPGLSNMVKQLGTINYFNDGWQLPLLDKLTRIYLVTEAYKQIEHHDTEATKEEIKSIIGFASSKEDILQQAGEQDEWIVLSRTLESLDQLTMERNWLYGTQTQRFALVLQYFTKGQLPSLTLATGSKINAALCFYNGINPVRALIKNIDTTHTTPEPRGYANLKEAFDAYNQAVATNPFLEEQPCIINQVRFSKQVNQNWLQDEAGDAVICTLTPQAEAKLLAASGGRKITVFGLLNEERIEPLSFWIGEKYISLGHAI